MGYSSHEFKEALKGIGEGEAFDDSRLLPFLVLESKEARLSVNLELAAAYFERYERASDRQSLERARACVDRALLLSRYSAEVLPLLIKINRALNDVGAIKEGLKRVGVAQAERGNFDRALVLFDEWAYADAAFAATDTHDYDQDIIAAVERMTALHRFEVRGRSAPAPGEKIRLAYLMQGLTEPGSVLVKIDKVFARLHNKSRFEVAYFAVDDEAEVAASPDARAAIQNIRGYGCQVFVAARKGTLYERLLAVGGQIHDYAADVLITSAGLATFKNYFVTCLKPAPVTVAFQQGPSAQFTWHTFDHSISWFRALLPDCPADCSHVPLEIDLPGREEIRRASRPDLGVPDTAAVIASGGRLQKFQDPVFWSAMAEIILARDDRYWLVIGVSEEQLPFLSSLLTPAARERIRLLGWRPDYLELLAAADLVVDSYPLGGGVFPIEAMSLGLPVLSFQHDYLAVFRNGEGSSGDEIVGIPELIVGRGDFDQLGESVSRLTDDAERRRRLGERCREQAHKTRGQPARMVRRCEEIYERVLRGRRTDGRQQRLPQGETGDAQLEDYRLFLREQADALNRREAELNRREARYGRNFFHWVWRALNRRRRALLNK